jgi:hypothetical protein
MKFLKNIATTTVVTAAILGAATLAQTQQAQAISLSFNPVRSNIDGDSIADVVKNPGDTLAFEIKLLVDSVNPVTNITYGWGYDSSELSLNTFTPSTLFANQNAVGPFAFPAVFGPATMNKLQFSWNGSLEKSPDRYTIGTVNFTALNTVNNGQADFGALLLSVIDSSGTELITASNFLTSSTYQVFEVQPTGRDIPTPALIPGIAAMGMGLLRRKKAQQAAA